MSQVDLALLRLNKNLARQSYERQTASAGGDGIAGIPSVNGSSVTDWGTRAGWEAFKSANGFYPFGWQNGSRVMPPSFAGAPDFVYELMGLRKPPVEVSP